MEYDKFGNQMPEPASRWTKKFTLPVIVSLASFLISIYSLRLTRHNNQISQRAYLSVPANEAKATFAPTQLHLEFGIHNVGNTPAYGNIARIPKTIQLLLETVSPSSYRQNLGQPLPFTFELIAAHSSDLRATFDVPIKTSQESAQVMVYKLSIDWEDVFEGIQKDTFCFDLRPPVVTSVYVDLKSVPCKP